MCLVIKTSQVQLQKFSDAVTAVQSLMYYTWIPINITVYKQNIIIVGILTSAPPEK